MRLRNVKNALEIINSHPLVIKEVTGDTFPVKQPVHVEIGAGKGDFLINMSKQFPSINFVAIEKYESVLVRALEKICESPNLRFLRLDAKDIGEVIKVPITAIYLNFSDPWPKQRHAKRRLTSENFLNIYEHLFVEEVNIFQKTDNKALFAYSICSLSAAGYQFREISLDLANSDIPNVPTEYEKKFMAIGTTINYLHATKKL